MMIKTYRSNKRKKTWFHHQLGQSLIEFALILPLFVLIVAGIFDLGRAFYSSITITNAAREGARYGTLNPDYSQGMCDTAWTEAANSGIDSTNSIVTLSCNNTVTCNTFGTGSAGCDHRNPITVTVTYTFNDMVLLGFFIPSGITMHRQEVMLVP